MAHHVPMAHRDKPMAHHVQSLGKDVSLVEYFQDNRLAIPSLSVGRVFLLWLQSTLDPYRLELFRFLLHQSKALVILPLLQECASAQWCKKCSEIGRDLGQMKIFRGKSCLHGASCVQTWDALYRHLDELIERELQQAKKSLFASTPSKQVSIAQRHVLKELNLLRGKLKLSFLEGFDDRLQRLHTRTVQAFRNWEKERHSWQQALQHFEEHVSSSEQPVKDYFRVLQKESDLQQKIQELRRKPGARSKQVWEFLVQWSTLQHREQQLVEQEKALLQQLTQGVHQEQEHLQQLIHSEIVALELEQHQLRELLQDIHLDEEAQRHVEQLTALRLQIPSGSVMQEYSSHMKQLKNKLKEQYRQVEQEVKQKDEAITLLKEEQHRLQHEFETARSAYERLAHERGRPVPDLEIIRGLQSDFSLSYDTYDELQQALHRGEKKLERLHRERASLLKNSIHSKQGALQEELLSLIKKQQSLTANPATDSELRQRMQEVVESRWSIQNRLHRLDLLSKSSEDTLRLQLLELEEDKFNLHIMMKSYLYYYVCLLVLELF